jgi:tetratricopeptide (TPR) repeat protein
MVDTGTFVAFSYLMLGRPDDVYRILDEIDEVAPRIGHLQALNLSRRVRFFSQQALDADGMLAYADDDLEQVKELEGEWLKDGYANQGWGAFWKGDWEEAEARYRLAIDEVSRGQPWVWNPVYPALLLHVLAYQGKRDEALAVFHANRADLPQPGKPSPLGAWGFLAFSIEALALLSEKDESHRLLPLIEECIGYGCLSIYGRSTHAAAGIAAAAGEDWDTAERHFEASVEWLARNPRFTEDFDTRRQYAAMLLARGGPGDRERAHALLDKAIAFGEAAGTVRHVELARKLQAGAGLGS